MPDGSKGYPETVVLRLIDSNGRPEVKIAASVSSLSDQRPALSILATAAGSIFNTAIS
jgi:hypothetical protein